MKRLFRTRADFRGLIEAFSSDVPDASTWARQILDEAAHVFDEVTGLGVQLLEHDADVNALGTMMEVSGAMAGATFSIEFLNTFGSELLRRLYFAPHPVVSVTEIFSSLGLDAHRIFAEVGYPGFHVSGLAVHPTPTLAAVLFWSAPMPRLPTPHEQRQVSTLALHFELATRARAAAPVTAVLSPSGEVLESDEAWSGPELWSALTTGTMSLAGTGRGPGRHYQLIANSPLMLPERRLTADERKVLELAASGMPGKQQAWELELAATTVSRLLSRAATKLGLPGSVEAIRFVSGLQSTHSSRRPAPRRVSLTPTEIEVMELVQQGLSNAQIGRARGRSTRTVANQVASILKKTGLPSRRALMAHSQHLHIEAQGASAP